MARTVIAHLQLEIVEEDGKLVAEITDSAGLPPLVPLINGPTVREELSLSNALALVGEAKDLAAKLLAGKKA